MSIVLKTNLKHLAPFAHVTASQHDALAMHATQMAIEECRMETSGLSAGPDFYCEWIKQRAAANLARMLGEGNGN